MIFYFTGTGNSLQAAKMLQEGTDEALIDIGNAVCSKNFTFELKDNEAVGFVFPVYFWGLPSIVSYFLKKFKFAGSSPNYIYSVITCGSSIAGADKMLKEKLEIKGYSLDAVFVLKMPDNYVILLDVPTEEEQCSILKAAEKEMESIRAAVASRSKNGYVSGVKDKLLSSLAYSFYIHGRKTKKFYTDDQCVGCGACANRCPNRAISMVDGKPVWVKDRCIHCLGCINRCGAIQYGKKTVNRKRYVNPVFKKKAHKH